MRAIRPIWIAYCLIGAAIIVFVAVNTINALYKGGDASDFLAGGSRALHGLALYQGSGPAQGFIGPPFQALFFVPFAAMAEQNEPVARLAWYVFNLVSLGCGFLFWYLACATAMSRWLLPDGRRALNVLAAVVATMLPLQTNFEHQNMNALLLGILGVGTWALVVGFPRSAGMAFGIAAALKIFPALVIVYLAVRGLWKAFFSAVLITTVLTILPVVIYGSPAFLTQLREWWQISSSGWPSRFNNQSLIAAIDRLTGGWKVQGIRTAAEAPLAVFFFAVLACALVALAVLAFSRHRWHVQHVPNEIAAVIVLCLLLSPIAWDHYWMLLFPAFLLMRYGAHPALLGKAATFTFWVAAVLTSGISRVTAGSAGWNVARRLSVSTAAAILLYLTLLRLSQSLSAASSENEVGRTGQRDQTG